jgi:hypothetical protein
MIMTDDNKNPTEDDLLQERLDDLEALQARLDSISMIEVAASRMRRTARGNRWLRREAAVAEGGRADDSGEAGTLAAQVVATPDDRTANEVALVRYRGRGSAS